MGAHAKLTRSELKECWGLIKPWWVSEEKWLARGLFVIVFALDMAIVGIGVYLFGFCKERMTLRVGLAMIVSGGIGNMIDRIAYGYVVDMLNFCLFDFWTWVFNVADAFVCVGAGVVVLALILDLIKESKEKKQKNENKQ